MKLRVRHKLVASSLALLLFGGLSATGLALVLARGWIEEGLREQAIGFARVVAAGIGDRREFESSALLGEQIAHILEVRPSILQLDILAFGSGPTRVVATSHPSQRLPFHRRDAEAVLRGQSLSRLVTGSGERYWEIMAPVSLEGDVVGAVAVKFSLRRADRLESQIRAALLTLTLVMVVVEGLLMGVAVRLFVDRPVGRFMDAIRRIGSGDKTARADVRTGDEFGVLAEHFDGMMARINRFSEELEARVEEATAELDRRYHDVERLNELLFRMQRTLSHADRLALSGRIMAEVAHEVGNPLHSVAGHLELLKKDLPSGVLTDDRVRRFAIIEAQLGRVTEIIARLLDLTRRSPGEPGEVDVNRVVRDTFDLVRPGLATLGLTLHAELRADLPAVAGHAPELQQVVLNLVTNAMDATASGGRIDVATRAIPLLGEVEIEVRDTGHGIPVADRPQIFEAFFSTKGPGRGTGLGLFISAQIVRDHKGRIDVESEEGRGSVFRIILPALATPA